MKINLYDPTVWIMLPLGIYMAVLQTLVLGNPPTVTKSQLGRLGRG